MSTMIKRIAHALAKRHGEMQYANGATSRHPEQHALERRRDYADEARCVLDAVREPIQAALKPFSDCCEQIGDEEQDREWAKFRLEIGDFRRARDASVMMGAAPQEGA